MAESMWEMWTGQQFGQIFHWRDANFFNVNSNCENLNGLTEKMYLRNVKKGLFLGPIRTADVLSYVICTVAKKTFWQNAKMHFWKGTSWTELSSCLSDSGMNVNFAFNFPTALCLTGSQKKEKHRTLFDGFFMLHETSQGFQTNASQIWFWSVLKSLKLFCQPLPEATWAFEVGKATIHYHLLFNFYSRKKHLFEFPLLNIWASQGS